MSKLRDEADLQTERFKYSAKKARLRVGLAVLAFSTVFQMEPQVNNYI